MYNQSKKYNCDDSLSQSISTFGVLYNHKHVDCATDCIGEYVCKQWKI